VRLDTIDSEVKAKIAQVKAAKKSSAYLGQCDAIERRIRQRRKERKGCLTQELSEHDVEVTTQLREQARLLTIKEETATDARRH
jgi:hypothetical protein